MRVNPFHVAALGALILVLQFLGVLFMPDGLVWAIIYGGLSVILWTTVVILAWSASRLARKQAGRKPDR